MGWDISSGEASEVWVADQSDMASPKPVACLPTGKNVHAAWPTPDQSMVTTANIAEKKRIRIWTNYQEGTFSYDSQKDVLDLQALESGERPDNAPICPIMDDTSTYAFVTLTWRRITGGQRQEFTHDRPHHFNV